MAYRKINEEHLTAIAEAIRTKAGTEDTYKPSEMAEAIGAIVTGGGELPAEAFEFTGDCQYTFYGNSWSWFINEYGNRITTKNVSNCYGMFQNNKQVLTMPFEINLSSSFTGGFNYMFDQCTTKELPLIKGDLPAPTGDYNNNPEMSSMFTRCSQVRNIPYDYFHNFGGEEFWAAAQQYNGKRNNMITVLSSLRQLPDISMLITKANGMYSLYYGFCTNCYSLDEIINVPVSAGTLTSNCFSSSTLNYVNRIKNFTFATNNNVPQVVNWKNQTIDLSTYVGYAGYDSNIIMEAGTNSGITFDKKVTDDATYQALKDDPDWFTTYESYSRYNHDSAVATINSLPDTSAYLATQTSGTNIIKFKGAAGAKTDGGAINTLTEEEIAVATAKGWTVSLV